MESYVFRTSCGALGYFQKSENTCHIYLEDEFFPTNQSFDWSEWAQYGTEAHTQSLPKTTLNDPISSAISYFIWHCRGETSPDVVELGKSILPAGDYFKRTNRDGARLFEKIRRHHSTIDEVRSYNNLASAMTDIFNVVEPDQKNKDVYGHRIRELLTIACTEVEYLFLQILKDNGYTSPRYSTNDYVKALPILKLPEYSAELKMHPSMGVFSPFQDWSASKPTESLSWYSSYNAAKHDRGGNFHKATLGAMINAIAAVHILLEAQYGKNLFENPLHSDYESCFQTINRPIWGCNEMASPLIEHAEKITWHNAREFFIINPV